MLFLLALVGLVSALPAPAQLAVNYQDSIARNRMYPACAAAYMNNPATCLKNAFPNTELKRQLTVACDETLVDRCSGFTSVDHAEQMIIVAYRGTNQGLELIVESLETIQKTHVPWISGGHVSKFFYDGFHNLWTKGMKDDFLTLRNQYPNYQVYVTGHSLGGALAVLGASWMAHNNLVPMDKLNLITFGEPRTGNTQFAESVDIEVPKAFRVTHAHDPVPHLPLNNMEGYKHHRNEVFYHEDMSVGANYTVCHADESKSCSDGQLLDTNTGDHVKYFNIIIGDLAEQICKETVDNEK